MTSKNAKLALPVLEARWMTSRSVFRQILPLLLWSSWLPPVAAQIVPDATLPNASTVTIDGNTRIIEGGSAAEGNLFHSFSEFSVPTGSEAFFNHAIAIENIITRVTGGQVSSIDGLIRANGDANLFLINPGGIEFGANARLDIGGSFFASTASGVQFDDGVEFSAANPQPLLSVNVPIGLQYGNNPAGVRGRGSQFDLQPQTTLALLGGTVELVGSDIRVPGGDVVLGGLSEAGTIPLDSAELQFPEMVARGDVSLSEGSRVAIASNGGGTLLIQGRNVSISDTQMIGGIAAGMGFDDAFGGDIDIVATGAVRVDNQSVVENSVREEGTGEAGNIRIRGDRILVQNQSLINTDAAGTGNAGNIFIETNTLEVSSGSTLASNSLDEGSAGLIEIEVSDRATFDSARVFTEIEADATSLPEDDRLGNIAITADSVLVTNNSLLSANTFGRGDAGAIDIDATRVEVNNGSTLSSSTLGQGNAGFIDIQGSDRIVFDNSRAFTAIGETGIAPGRTFDGMRTAGDVFLSADTVELRNGARLAADTGGMGSAGEIGIVASETVGLDNARISTDVREGAEGDAGGIVLKTPNLEASNDSVFSSSTAGRGSAGLIEIIGDRIAFDNSRIFTEIQAGATTPPIDNPDEATFGDIVINANTLTLANGTRLSAETLGRGDAGEIGLIANTLDIRGDSNINSNTAAAGNAGGITIAIADSARIENSLVSTDVKANATGNAGSVEIRANRFDLVGGTLSSSTAGRGNAGFIEITSDRALFDNARVFSEIETTAVTPAVGNREGDIDVLATHLIIANNSQLSADTFGLGDAGDITLEAATFELTQNSSLTSTTSGMGSAGEIQIQIDGSAAIRNSGISTDVRPGAMGEAGDIAIASETLDVLNDSTISSSTFGEGDAGEILLTGRDRITLNNSRIFTNVANTATGIGGLISLQTDGSLNLRDMLISSSSAGRGQAGDIELFADTVQFNNTLLAASTTFGDGGNILVNASDITRLNRTSRIATNAGTQGTGGNGGNVTLNGEFILGADNSDITANAFNGAGGFIQINSNGIFGLQAREQITPDSDITAISRNNPALSGEVEINAIPLDTAGLVGLPTNLVDVTALVGTDPCATGRQSQFVVTGRGGLPPNPSDPLTDTSIRVEPMVGEGENNGARVPNRTRIRRSHSNSSPVVEARGWTVDASDRVTLVAENPDNPANSNWQQIPACGDLQQHLAR